MTFYLFKRIAIILPALALISCVVFLLLDLTARNIVEKELARLDWSKIDLKEKSIIDRTNEILEKYNYDKPLFYFSISNAADPDTLYKIYPIERRKLIKRLSRAYKDEKLVADLIKSLDESGEKNPELVGFYHSKNKEEFIDKLQQYPPQKVSKIKYHFDRLANTESDCSKIIPAINWYGTSNRYHIWITGVFRGDLGRSIVNGLPVKYRLFPAIKNSMVLGSISIFLLFLIGIPIGITMSYKSDKVSWLSSVFYSINAMPLFWIAEILILLFASKTFFHLFPSYGVGKGDSVELNHLILPVGSLVISALPIVVMQTKSAIDTQLNMPYVLMTRVKGLSQKKILLKHVLRNALNPIITLFTGFLPATVGGVMIVEYVFSIPGVGRLLVEAIDQYDYPLIIIIIVLIGLVKMLSNFLADIGYRVADPRISF